DYYCAIWHSSAVKFF
nr:immunoglobulin light chain junction region [Macaca mulatta]